MHRFSIIALALLALAGSAHPQEPPSLAETTAWLTATLNKSARYVVKNSDGTSSLKIENVRFDGCALTYEDRIVSDVISSVGTIKLRLADIDPSNYEISQEEGYLSLKFKTRGDRDTIRFDGWSTMDGKRHAEAVSFGEVTFPFTEKDLAERVAKAFAHAATLCAKK